MNELAVKKIVAAREKKRYTQSQVAEKLAKALGQTYSLRNYQKLESGVFPKFKREVVTELEKILGIRVYELIYEQVEGSNQVNEDPAPYHVERMKKKTEEDPETDGITYVPISAKAGYLTNISDPVYLNQLERVYIPGFPYRGERYRIFEVEGDSMEPTLSQGYYIVAEKVDPEAWHQIANFYIHIVVLENDILIKRLFRKDENYFVIISDNDEFYPQFLLPASEIKELWAVKRKIDWNMPPPKRFEIKV